MARAYRKRFVVVFDGAPEDGLPSGGGVRVRFAGAVRPADVITQYIDHDAYRRSLCVVTSDHELAVRAAQSGVGVLSASLLRGAVDPVSRSTTLATIAAAS
jgi:hypothetical protein